MKLSNKIFYCAFILSLPALFYACSALKDTVKRDASGKIVVKTNPSSKYLSPKESLQSFHLPKGYRMELVASEPMISEPVAITFDGNGRMFVAEMNTYMKDVKGTGQMEPVCTVKRLEDTNGDGVMDKSVIFIDKLILPRLIQTLDDRLLVAETNSNNIYSYRDTDGDGKADEKKLVYRNDVASTNNLEHQKSGLIWNLDNRLYVTYDNIRYRYNNGELKAEKLINGSGGQWGLANDNYGRLFYSSAGGETPALDFQQNPYFGRLDIGGQYDQEFRAVWPIISTPDVQGGVNRLRKDSTLNNFTACSGQSVFRGNSLPADMVGDLLIPEPVGRLIRRAKVTNTDGFITLKNAYKEEEFLASTDMNFRPVNSLTGPDGCLYIVDMYHGIIQESNWTKSGTFLGAQILSKKFDKNIGRGRIYRLVYDGIKPDKTKPNTLGMPSSELVQYLSHPNGWWRDNAQKLMVIKGDQSVAPALKDLVLNSPDPLARIHAIWTLDGLKALDKSTLQAALKDKDANVRKNAVWVAEEAITKGDEGLITFLEPFVNDESADVRFQLALSLRFSESEKAKSIINELVEKYPKNRVLTESYRKYFVLQREQKLHEMASKQLAEEDRKLVLKGATIYSQLCTTCHGPEGKGVLGAKDLPAPPLAANKQVNGDPVKLIRILLQGLKGPIDGKVYADEMPALGANDDEYIASILSYIRNGMGNKASAIKPNDVKKVREQTVNRAHPWTWVELNSSK
ncbi:cytochrome C [Pedobacter hiemivivus]|uniref:Cytochrome C n=1 Tax=Pedobacter hiemivivus TaxID=2530454 RepID=A0A4U1GDR6_9SPHI|nr:PVC-type heme-binding CxxCH protein [Pedobacter hiemivivus]TKC62058.1 cytochrome C [Pedobacter hiemivivus]